MSRGSAEELARRLASDLRPVRPLPRLRVALGVVLAAWGLAMLAYLATGDRLATLAAGLPWASPGFAGALVGLALAAAGGTLCALADAVPGRECEARGGRALAAAGLALAAAGGVRATAGADPTLATPTGTVMCILKATALGLLPALGLAAFLSWGAPGRPLAAGVGALLGAGALGAFVVHLACRADGPLHVLLGHALAPVLIALVLGLPLAAVLRRRRGS